MRWAPSVASSDRGGYDQAEVIVETDWSSLTRVEYLERRLREAVGASDAAIRDDQWATARSWEDTASKLRRDLDDARGAAASDEERVRRLTALDPRDVARRVSALAPHLARLAPAEARAAAEAILAALPREPAAIVEAEDPGPAAGEDAGPAEVSAES